MNAYIRLVLYGLVSGPALGGPAVATQFQFERRYIDTNYGGNGKPGWVRAGDMDADGDVDIVAGGGRALFVYEHRDGDWVRHGSLDATNRIGCNGAALHDVDGDGDLDVVGAVYKRDLGWWENPGGQVSDERWAFHRIDRVADGAFLHDVIRGDLDNDGRADDFICILTKGHFKGTYHVRSYRPLMQEGLTWRRVSIAQDHPGPKANHAGVNAADIDGDGDVDLAVCDGWFESSGTADGCWTWHKLTDIYGVSNILARDVDSDGDLDLVMSAGHHGQGVYWIEQPGNLRAEPWPRHAISPVLGDVTRRHVYREPATDYLHHPEGLQVADIDADGDLDVVVAELFFGEDPDEPGWRDQAHNLYVYENLGGRPVAWRPQTIAANSYPCHQLQLADIDADGRLDVIAEGCGVGVISYYRNVTSLGPTARRADTADETRVTTQEVTMSNQPAQTSDVVRVPVTVDVGTYGRHDKPVELELSAHKLGLPDAVWPTLAVSVVEVDDAGATVHQAVTSQVTSRTKDAVSLVFLMPGDTKPRQKRHFHVLLGDASRRSATQPADALVTVTENVARQGEQYTRIDTPKAQYFFHMEGAGFGGLIDTGGKDWISYRTKGGPKGHYRGIPNLVHPEGHFHPGSDTCTSRMTATGPIVAVIEAESKDGQWAVRWDVFPHYARMTLQRAGHAYWFLYEGTPGGRLDEQSDWMVLSSGQRYDASQRWDRPIESPEWIYFVDGRSRRLLYLVHHEADNEVDSYWPMQQAMTVFGFGRRDLNKFMTAVPTHFTIGLADDPSPNEAKAVIHGAYEPLDVTIGSAQPPSRQP